MRPLSAFYYVKENKGKALVVIFLLLIKIFAMDRKIAKIEHQMTEMTQKIAMDGLNRDLREKNGVES